MDKAISKKKAIILALVIGILAFIAGSYLMMEEDEETLTPDIGYTDEKSYNFDIDIEDSCNVMAFSLNGYMSTYTTSSEYGEETGIPSSEDIVDGILFAQDDQEIRAIILSIDSSGGDGVAGEEIANALKRLDKPSIAVIRGIGASAAYWAATGADKIYASKISDVGSIGVTVSYLDETKKIEQEGYQYKELSSAKYKDLGDPSRTLTAEEEQIVLSDLRKVHNVFVESVATNRGIDIKKVEKLANGLTYIGEDALQYGLIDEIGDLAVAMEYIESQIEKKVKLCWY